MTTAEGAIQFRYTLDPPGDADLVDNVLFAQMAAWRIILRQLGLVGRDPKRYDGYAYGNLSVRDCTDARRFFVTASQTGGEPDFGPSHLVRIDRWDCQRFSVCATGSAPPSSESITHGMLYAADPAILWVMHVHSTAIWRAAPRLGLPVTDQTVSYGSAAMANAVAALLRQHRQRPLAIATLGHEDGVFASGASASGTGAMLVQTLADALGDDRDQPRA